jgi:hypothetical protein
MIDTNNLFTGRVERQRVISAIQFPPILVPKEFGQSLRLIDRYLDCQTSLDLSRTLSNSLERWIYR